MQASDVGELGRLCNVSPAGLAGVLRGDDAGVGAEGAAEGRGASGEQGGREVTVNERAKLLHCEPDMVLPEGKTCKDCIRFLSCAGFLGQHIQDNQHCDWSPSYFRDRVIQGSGEASK